MHLNVPLLSGLLFYVCIYTYYVFTKNMDIKTVNILHFFYNKEKSIQLITTVFEMKKFLYAYQF